MGLNQETVSNAMAAHYCLKCCCFLLLYKDHSFNWNEVNIVYCEYIMNRVCRRTQGGGENSRWACMLSDVPIPRG